MYRLQEAKCHHEEGLIPLTPHQRRTRPVAGQKVLFTVRSCLGVELADRNGSTVKKEDGVHRRKQRLRMDSARFRLGTPRESL